MNYLTNMWNKLVVWVSNNWKTVAGVVVALLAHLVVVSLGVVLVMVLFGLPAGTFVQVLCLALLFGFIDRRGAQTAQWVLKKVRSELE